MDLGRLIRQQVREALDAARKRGPTNVASATSVSSSGHTTSVYSDNDVTIIERDGKRQVIRHGPDGDEDDKRSDDTRSDDTRSDEEDERD